MAPSSAGGPVGLASRWRLAIVVVAALNAVAALGG
jgi:hypothetical protein